jgi:hypothetical protein
MDNQQRRGRKTGPDLQAQSTPAENGFSRQRGQE